MTCCEGYGLLKSNKKYIEEALDDISWRAMAASVLDGDVSTVSLES